MAFELTSLLIACAGAIYFMLPAYVANLSGLVFGGGEPVDSGKNFSEYSMHKGHFTDDRRFIGNGVTWRGTFCGTVVGTFVGGLLGFIGASFGDLSQLTYGVIGIHAYGSVIAGFGLGFLMAFGALAGDAAGSFLKRRLGLQSGDPAPFLDQLDFVCGALVFSLLVVPLSLDFVLLIMAISIVLHLGSNTFAYLIGMKDVWY